MAVSEAIRRVVGIKHVPEVIAGLKKTGFSNCTGAINETHVPIEQMGT